MSYQLHITNYTMVLQHNYSIFLNYFYLFLLIYVNINRIVSKFFNKEGLWNIFVQFKLLLSKKKDSESHQSLFMQL